MQLTNFPYVQRSGVWRAAFHGEVSEVNLAGDANGPFPECVAAAEACEKELGRMRDDAVRYIAEHVKETLAVSGTPETEWINVGLNDAGDRVGIEFFFSDDQTYVLWTVRFSLWRKSETVAVISGPNGFSRRNW